MKETKPIYIVYFDEVFKCFQCKEFIEGKAATTVFTAATSERASQCAFDLNKVIDTQKDRNETDISINKQINKIDQFLNQK